MTALAMILDAAARWPDRAAIEEADGEPVSYAALIARARSHAVRGAGVVEIRAERSAELVARCLGAWLAARAWTPLDPAEPVARRDAIRTRVASAGGADLAYVIATSGSGGAPKAVMVGHRGIPALLRAQIDAFHLGPGARSLWLHAPGFDASVSDWATALASGATLVIPGAADLGELARRAITHVDLPPALLGGLGELPETLRVVILGGEACPVARVRELARRVRVVVVYGPTEATVCASLVAVDAARWTRPLIGAPLPGVVFRVIDGELYIGGDCLALGYAGDPDETARRFVVRDGERLYRTGDRVEAGADGLAFAGRLDRQRKIRGRRVELDEIDAALRALPGVCDAATEVRGPVLVGFVEGEGEPAALRDALRPQLPVSMLPARIVMGPLPRTASGKIDRAALAICPLLVRAPDGADALTAELAALWCDALGAEAVEDGDRFRDAGGDSLTAMTLAAATAARALPLDPAFLVTDPSFAELVSAVRTTASTNRALTVADCESRGLARLAEIRSGHPPCGSRVRSGHPPPGSRILITGASGLLGAHLGRAWPEALALVRNPDTAPPGLEVVVGDLARAWLGLAPDGWARLVREVGTIIHAGARIALPLDWQAHAATNVDGTAWIARLAAESGAAWHHVSTLSVFVGTDRAAHRCARTDLPDPAAHAFGGYAQTKIAAEAVARASGARIYRLGLLVEDALREGTQLGMIARGLAKLGAAPAGDPQLAFDVTPVTHAARAIVAAVEARHDAHAFAAHHIAGRHATLADLAGALPTIPAPTWAERARPRLADPEIAMAYLSLARLHGDAALCTRARPFDLFLATGADFDAPPLAVDLAALCAVLA